MTGNSPNVHGRNVEREIVAMQRAQRQKEWVTEAQDRSFHYSLSKQSCLGASLHTIGWTDLSKYFSAKREWSMFQRRWRGRNEEVLEAGSCWASALGVEFQALGVSERGNHTGCVTIGWQPHPPHHPQNVCSFRPLTQFGITKTLSKAG